MSKNKVLTKLFNNKLNVNKAYQKLYKELIPKRARYVKFRITMPESRGMTMFLKALFLLPISIWLLKCGLKRSDQAISEKIPIKIKDIISNGLYKETFIKVNAKDGTKVLIKTI